jgi:acetyl esterase
VVDSSGRIEVEAAVLDELRAHRAKVAAMTAGRPAPHTLPTEEVRRRVRSGAYPALVERVRLPRARDITVPGRDGDIGLRVLAPEGAAPTGVYLFMHGGGFVFGGADAQDPVLGSLVESTGMCAVSVDYRLALEHPYPAGPDDCEDAALWLLDGGADRLGAPPSLTIGGDSAGAHLAVVTLLRLRDRHGVTGAFRAANLIYGWFDIEPTPSVRHAGDDMVAAMSWLADRFLPDHDARARRDPDISPLYADLRGLPPALFTVGDVDHLLDDTLFMEARWRIAGPATRLLVWPEAPHAFNAYPVELARRAQAEQHAFLAAAVRAAPAG